MDFRGLAVGAGNVARGYRAAETELRAAEEERLKLQQLRMEQAERNRQEAKRRADLEDARALPEARVSIGGIPEQALPGMQLPAPQGLPIRIVRPPAAPVVPEGYGTRATEDRRFTPEVPVAASGVATTYPVLPPNVELLGQQYETARSERERAENTLHSFGSRQQAGNPEGFEAAKVALARARAAEAAAQQTYQTAATEVLSRTSATYAGTVAPARRTPPAATAPVPTTPGTVPAATPPNTRGLAPNRVLPETQAQRDVQAAKIRATELGTVAKADEELRALDRELRQRNLGTEKRDTLTKEREFVAAARELLAQREAAPAAATAAAAAAPVVAAAAAEAAEEPPPGPAVAALQRPAGVELPEDDNAFQQAYADPRQITADQKHLEREYSLRRQNIVDVAVSAMTNLDMTYRAEREELVVEYNAQIQAGLGPAAKATRRQIIKLDADYRTARTLEEAGARNELLDLDSRHDTLRRALIGQAAVAQLVVGRNPTAAAQVVSYMSGSPVQFRLTSDGKVDMLLPQADGSFAVRGTYSIPDIADMVNNWSSQQYRDAKAAMQREVAIQVSGEQAKQIRELAVARQQGVNKLQEITLRGQQFIGQADGNGGVILYTPDGSRAGRLVERKTTVDGLPVSTFVLQPIQMPPR